MLTSLGFFDISANLIDPKFQGIYNGNKVHEPDVPHVLKRAWNQGVKKIIIKGTNLTSSLEAVALAKTNKKLYCTVGCSALNTNEFDEQGREDYFLALRDLCLKNRRKVVALGECGLDFDNVDVVDAITQLKFFRLHVELSMYLELPLLIHYRSAGEDLIKILKSCYDDIPGVVIRGFQGSEDEVQSLMRLGCFFGLDGSSFETQYMREVVKDIPSQQIMFASNAPYDEITSGQYIGSKYVKTFFPSVKKRQWSPEMRVKGRNEPGNIVQVLEVAAAIKNENPDTLAHLAYRNSKNFFLSPTRKFTQ